MTPAKNNHEHSHDSRFMVFGERTELVFSLLSGACLVIGFLLAIASSAQAQISLTLHLLAYFFGGFFVILEVRQSLSHGKFQIDFLMLVAAAGAGILGEWAEGALLLFLFSFGHALESFAMGKARTAIAASFNPRSPVKACPSIKCPPKPKNNARPRSTSLTNSKKYSYLPCSFLSRSACWPGL